MWRDWQSPFITSPFIALPMLCWAIHWRNSITLFQDLDEMNEIPNFKSMSAEFWSRRTLFYRRHPGEKLPKVEAVLVL